MPIKPDNYEQRFRDEIEAINTKPNGPLRVRTDDTDTELAIWIESRDGSEEYHFLRMHQIQSVDDPFYMPNLGLGCWFAYDNIDQGHYFESRKFAMYTLVTWFDDMVYDAEQRAMRLAAERV